MASYTRTNERRPPAVVKHSRRVSGEVVGGLDADLKAREAAKRDTGLEGQAIAFLEALTGAEISDMLVDLKDGVILCNAINAIAPNSVRRVNKSKMPFKQMENVSNFIKACWKLGVPEYALFTTPDLYDGKSVVNVTNGIIALGSKAQSLPGTMDLRSVPRTAQQRRFMKQSKWKIGAGGGGVSKMMMGSAGVMQRGDIRVGRQDGARMGPACRRHKQDDAGKRRRHAARRHPGRAAGHGRENRGRHGRRHKQDDAGKRRRHAARRNPGRAAGHGREDRAGTAGATSKMMREAQASAARRHPGRAAGHGRESGPALQAPQAR